MAIIKLSGRITDTGDLEVQLPEGLPAGDVTVSIELPTHETSGDDTEAWTPEEIAAFLTFEPKTGAEIIAAGHVGGWEHRGIEDSEAWVQEQRERRAAKRDIKW